VPASVESLPDDRLYMRCKVAEVAIMPHPNPELDNCAAKGFPVWDRGK